MRNLASNLRKHPWLFGAVAAQLLLQAIIGVRWILSNVSQWHEPTLFVLSIAALSLGIPDLHALLKSEAELERRIAEGLVTCLEDEGLLKITLDEADHPEHPKRCYDTARRLRSSITSILAPASRSSTLYMHVEALREDLRQFARSLEQAQIEEVERETELSPDQFNHFRSELVKLRINCAFEIKRFSAAYGVDAETLLKSIARAVN